MDREGEAAAPLDGVSSTQARFECTDLLLSEAVVRGFESGYSLADPLTLTLWEARRSAPYLAEAKPPQRNARRSAVQPADAQLLSITDSMMREAR